MALMLLGNTAVFRAELTQISRRGLAYCGDVWNQLDLIGVAALYASGFCFFCPSTDSDGDFAAVVKPQLRYLGAIGVLANAFALLQILRPFDATGPVIKMTVAMLQNKGERFHVFQ